MEDEDENEETAYYADYKQMAINWIGAIILAIIVFAGINEIINSPPQMSEGHKAADARYMACLKGARVTGSDGYANVYSPETCNGALGEYQKPAQ